ncbi:MAG: phosphate acetyltransferase [Clostridia bacterium]|nr:phosphate acetyltransferase [Clostridia bacterium]
MGNVFDKLIEKAKHTRKKIILNEVEDKRVLEAAEKAAKMDLCTVIILGKESELKNKFSEQALKNIEFIDVETSSKLNEYAELLFELRKAKGMTEDQAHQLVLDKMMYANLMLKTGDADGLVSGAITHTADVLRPAFQVVKVKPGISKVSSVFIMESPSDAYGENGFLIFADCGVNPNPTAEDLAEIAICSSETAEVLCGMKPKVALLSYSTKSGDEMKDENILKIKKALQIVKEKAPKLNIDGELQADAALVESVGKLKSPESKVAGKANVLIFPDLNSGNIAYKLVQRLAGVKAVGPILQGLNAPVNDLSRGTTADEIVLCMAITVLQAQNKK